MADLIVNTENLRDLATQLGSIQRTLSGAEGAADELAGMVGHARLADTVRSFADGWDRRRRELTDQVTALHERAKGVADAFEQTDAQLADKMESAAS